MRASVREAVRRSHPMRPDEELLALLAMSPLFPAAAGPEASRG